MGRPAVTSKYILASGDGLVYRIDKQKYNLERLHLASSNAILGNLVSADGQLYAANMLGVSCYKSYDAAREHLTERINQSEPLLKAELLFKRGHLAFVTRRFDMALADFEACRDIAADLDELQRDSYMAALRPRLYRAYVAMGNVSSDRDRRLEHFEQAMALAEEPGEKGRMLIRLAKHYEDVGQFDKAIEAAQKVSEDFGSIPLEDVGVGPGADTSVTVRETAATHFGRQWSRDYVGRLVRVHGQEIYEPWNARVRERLDQAVATGDPAAIEEVIDAYPHSRHIPEARLRSAEMYYLQARRRTGRAQAEKFGKAQNQLMSVSTADDVSVKASAIVGMVAINVASGATMSAERNLKRAASIPQDTPVSFAGFEGPLGDVAKRVLKNEAPPVPDVTPLSLKKLRDIDANEAYIVADQDGRALTAGNEAFVLEGQLLQIWELDKADKEDYKPRTVDLTVNVHAEAKVSRASPSAAFSASLRAGGKELWLAGGHDVVGVDLAKGEVIKTADLETDGQRAARIVDFAFTSNMLVAVDYAGLIKAINIPDGSLAWISQVETDNRSRSVQLLANDQAVVIVSSQQRDVHVFNAAGGKEIYNSKAEARASAAFTKDGKLLLTRDNAVSLRNVGADTIDKPVAGFVFEDTDTATVIAAGEQYAVLQLDGNDERFVAIPLASLADGKTMELDPKIKIKGKTAQPIGAIVDGPSIYLFGSRSQPRSVSRPGEIRYVQGLTLTKFEMPEAAIAWESTVQVPQRSPVHLASLTVANGNLVLGLRSMSTSPMAYLSVTLDEQGKVTELGILRIDVKKNRQARMRQRYAGVAAVAGNRMLVETPTGLRLYGEK
jgi:tetratricopeptide (TPR) repeat protein